VWTKALGLYNSIKKKKRKNLQKRNKWGHVGSPLSLRLGLVNSLANIVVMLKKIIFF
jgi:hypothetical protein